MRNRKYTIAGLFLALFLLLTVLPANAQTPEETRGNMPAGLRIQRVGADTQIDVNLSRSYDAAALSLPDWEMGELNGYELPVQLVTLLVDADAPDAPDWVVRQLDAAPWRGELAAAADQALPDLAPDEMPDVIVPESKRTLPQEPIIVLRDGRMRGQRIRVLAINPIFAQGDRLMRVEKLSVTIPHARPLEESPTDLFYAADGPVDILADDDLTPPNSAANQQAAKVLVRDAGLQSVPLSALQAAGLAIGNPAQLGVMHQGEAVPVQIEGQTLTFYAEGAGDYWNETDVYWVTDDGSSVTAIPRRSVAPDAAPLRSVAYEEGVWQVNHTYTSLLPGPGGDHWFAMQMRAASSTTEADLPMVEGVMENRLPLTGAATLEVRSATSKRAAYQLKVEVGQGSGADFRSAAAEILTLDTWSEPSNENDWIATSNELNGRGRQMRITLLPPAPVDNNGMTIESVAELFLDEVVWRQKVTLNFSDAGAAFLGYDAGQIDGDQVRYQLQNVPAAFRLYDITDPALPVRLTDAARSDSQITFQDDTSSAHRYLVAGTGTIQTPEVAAHNPTDITAAGQGADIIYITPDALRSTLQPLVDYRKSQPCLNRAQCRVAVVDVHDIYDAYSYAYVDPEAIRQFLRYAAANWDPAPIAVVLVGDGTQDPHNYEGNELNPNLIPPYLAYSLGNSADQVYVDPFIRQTGCENCFVQLDGIDALTGDEPVGSNLLPGSSFFPDMMIGRLPVKNAAELRDLIDKMVRYETDYNEWDTRNSKLTFLTDNYIKNCDPDGPRDTAGNFAAYSDEIISTLPDSLIIDRIYYDPTQIYDPNDLDGDGSICNYATPNSSDGYREGNPWTVYNKVQSTLRRGAALVTYNGHASQWRWAITDRETNSTSSVPKDAPEHLFYIWDVLSLNNADQPFIALSMACLSSQFHKPVDWGMTLDEHLLLRANGGAVATWGSSGLSVAQGHFALERGFHRELWSEGDERARMGELTLNGYFEQYTRTTCCDDVRRTFLLMGDPMTQVRLSERSGAYLPIIGNN
ncbi:MAG: hypothetical protein KDD92_16460 [Caldilineaceae bacterium]|nr:hypothetical protein [Caldilineaceae bacterium]